jgi:hypothetical protein
MSFRQSLSPLLQKYIENLLHGNLDTSKCKDLVEEVLRYTCHVARVRSIAYAAGFCAYYARMIEKMGVFEVIEGSIPSKGRALHRILSLVSQNLFSQYSLEDVIKNDEILRRTIDEAINILGEEIGVKTDAYNMMQQLLEALSRLYYYKKLIDPKLFPLTEQEFIDFDDHMYGVPDLILEDLNKKKAVVVEWKSRTGEESGWSDVDIAQVVAYSIMEARRLGIRGLKNVFEAILGTDIKVAREIARIIENINKLKRHRSSSEEFVEVKELNDKLTDLVRKARDNIESKLRIIPIIITTSKSFPPHPLMYRNGTSIDFAKRLSKLYRMLKRVIIAAEHLTLQLTNTDNLLAEVRGQSLEEIRKSLEHCRTIEGYYAFNYTPCRLLRCGKPINQSKWPCKTKKGKPFCSFVGENGPCKFYFGRKEKEEFDIIMWKLRYKVFEEKERSLVSYRAMDILFKKIGLKWIFDSNVEKSCKGFKVDIAGETVRVERGSSVVFYVRVLRGGKELDKLRFDIIDLNSGVETEEGDIIIKRELRDIERDKGLAGTIKRSSVVAYIVTPQLLTPLLTINTFLMVRDCDIEENVITYYLYNPSSYLYHTFELFKRYIKIFRDNNYKAKLLLFEANANLTLMELRAIDALHRFIAQIKEKSAELAKDYNLPSQDIERDVKILEKVVHKADEGRERLIEETPLYTTLLKVFERKVQF